MNGGVACGWMVELLVGGWWSCGDLQGGGD